MMQQRTDKYAVEVEGHDDECTGGLRCSHSSHRTFQIFEGRPITITTLAKVDMTESSIWTLDVQWTHGIYGTDEHAKYALVFDAYGADYVVDMSDGEISEWRETNPLHASIGAHAAEQS
jgi:hypothetical protein